MKRKIMWIFIGLILYIIIGSTIPFINQQRISDTYKNDFNIDRFYERDGSVVNAYPIRDNDEARVERIRAIANAKDKIILSSYRLRADDAGKLYIASLVDAAKRGVEIEIILDGNTLKVNSGKNNYYMALESFDNVNIRIYNPMRFLKPWTLHGRMHDKYMIVDDQVLFMGGRNIENRFLITNQNQSYDWDILMFTKMRGHEDIIDQLKSYFYSIYNDENLSDSLDKAALFANDRNNDSILMELENLYSQSELLNSEDFEPVDYMKKGVLINKASLISNPVGLYNKEPTVFFELTELMLTAKKNLTIHTPYYIGNQMMYDKTREIAKSVDANIFTNSPANNANLVGAGDLLIHKRKFRDLGLNILLNSNENSYHGKAFVMDDDISGIGSFNWDMRSVYIDTELMMVINDKEFNDLIRRDFDYYEHDASRVTKEGDIINPSGKDYIRANFAKRFISVFFVILFYPLRFLF